MCRCCFINPINLILLGPLTCHFWNSSFFCSYWFAGAHPKKLKNESWLLKWKSGRWREQPTVWNCSRQKWEGTVCRRIVHTTNTRGGGRLYYPHLATSTTDIKPDSEPLPLANRVSQLVSLWFISFWGLFHSNYFFYQKNKQKPAKALDLKRQNKLLQSKMHTAISCFLHWYSSMQIVLGRAADFCHYINLQV